jgi:pimeloyl-ACP methyl ester carboxylesterase
MARIESLLSARLFVAPQLAGDFIYFMSNMSGQLSLYRMKKSGSVPQPLIPPNIALQNPDLLTGESFAVLPGINQVLVMIDQNGDEQYKPMAIPPAGGFPEPIFADEFQGYRVNLFHAGRKDNIVYFWVQSNAESKSMTVRANLETGKLEWLAESKFGAFLSGASPDHNRVIVQDAYGAGDQVMFLREGEDPALKLVYGIPLSEREPGQEVPPNGFGRTYFVHNDRALLVSTVLFDDTYGLALLPLDDPQAIRPVAITGLVHTGEGELEDLEQLAGNRYALHYNIDACSWLYEAAYDEETETMQVQNVVCGQGQLADGVLKGSHYDPEQDKFVLSFTTATSPTQIFLLGGNERDEIFRLTDEQVLGLPDGILSPGEDASFISHDGLRISARLYLPDESLPFTSPYPLVYYVHGGPTSQEHPDFAWFSMPLIQFLTLNGFAVFVPNVRGSTGYGYAYMNRVMHDWGGQDRLDHVHAMTKVLPADERLDTGRAAVMGRSYGGYMTLTLAGRHPELWSSACDMFGPYDLLTFANRVPETWKPYIAFMVGDPETEQDFLQERSPRTYIHNLQCPLLVIQGKNDPRVWEQESRELVDELQEMGKDVDYLMFADEGHDVLKYENRVRCYNAINDFFKTHLM